ncbi:MAG: hypothetical protein ABL926_00385 [Novosphingobium sp.]|uniref:hypothetical protein n=1 Tax=Novosphingobium sp. TaxID=1874826 RepID=UPI0032B7F4EB
MTRVDRVDQAILLLKDRLRRLGERKAGQIGASSQAGRTEAEGQLAPVRQLARQGNIGEHDLRKALVRALLANALGEKLATGIQFLAVADRVTAMLEADEGGRELIDRALAELG